MFPDTQLKFLLELLSSEMHNHFRGYLLVLTVSFKKNQALRQQKMQGNILHTIPLFVEYSIEPLRQTIVLERAPIEIRLFTIVQNNLKVLLEQYLEF